MHAAPLLRPRRYNAGKTFLGLGVALVLIVLYWANLLSSQQLQRQELQAQTRLRITQVAHVLANQTETLFSIIDYATDNFAKAYGANNQEAVQRLLASLTEPPFKQAVAQLAIADAQGKIIYSSLTPQKPSASAVFITDRQHFAVHAQGQVQGLYVGQPVLGRVSQQWTIQLSRALHKPDGSFAGVLVVSIPTSYLSSQFHNILGQPNDVVSLRRASDGSFLARSAHPELVLGQQQSVEVDHLIAAQPAMGSADLVSSIDHIQRIYAWHTTARFDLRVIAGVDRQAVMAPLEANIHKNQVLSGIATVLALLGMLLLAYFSVQRQRSERALNLAHKQLTALVERFPAGVVLESPNHPQLLTINPTLVQLLGLRSTAQLSRQDLGAQIPESLRPVLLPTNPQAEYPEGQEVTLDDGRVLEVVQFLLQDNQQRVGRLSLVHDVTARHQQQSALVQLALTDALTGLPNRRAFMHALERECVAVHAGDLPEAALLFLDIDHFKRVNDTYGHGVGDEVLSHLGALLRRGLRTSDIPGRIGGEEFAVLLPNINLEQAQLLAERLRKSFEDNPASTSAGPLEFRASFGVCPLLQDEASVSASDYLQRADMALYWAKNHGRNQVCTWHPGLAPR